MKILKATIFYVLPDDFDGDLNEALELWAHHKDHRPAGEGRKELSSEALFANLQGGFKTVYDVNVWRKMGDSWRSEYPQGAEVR